MEVSDILLRVPIEKYIGQYAEDMVFRDGEYWMTSLFNPSERTPSFSIRPGSDEKYGVYYDFSSGKHGNLLNFVMAYKHYNFHEAIDDIKKFGNIVDTEPVPQARALSATVVSRQYRARASTVKHCTAKPLPPDYMDRYEWDESILKLWVDEGIPYTILREFDVRYDPFSQRIVFPIRDLQGNILSICGRTIDPDFKSKRLRKYTYFQSINSLDTIYGFYRFWAKQAPKNKPVILFEGAKSCMKAVSFDRQKYGDCGALCTSHLNENQFRLLVQLGRPCVFALDSDVKLRADKNIMRLCKYVPVEAVINRDGLLAEKDAPVDQGKDIWETLYRQRIKLN